MRTCSACSTDNPDVAKFCIQCGASMAPVCRSCGTAAPPGARFCMECGTALTTTTDAPSSPVRVAGEKKHITVLFADVAGSMDLQERLDAEVWAAIMGRFVQVLAEGVRRFGGTVDKFTGDGIMALFGAPVAQEDHARRACHAAWQLTKTIREYSEELQRTHGVELGVRLGLNSGEVVVGRVGDDVTLDPTALGHTVGLAQRMEAMAESGTACLTEATARLVEGWFQLENFGPVSVKGAREPLTVYALTGRTPSPPVLHGTGALGPAPLVGRERELAVLGDALAMAEQGHAQVVGVVGEAGVGKSRLCDEFARACVTRGLLVRRTVGVSHGRDLPLLPILALLRDYFRISENDGPEQARDKISGHLLGLDPALDESLPLLFDFLDVPDPQRPIPRLAPEARMRRVFETLRRVIQRRSEQETLVLVFEDLHWFDPQSATFLERLIESFPGSRTLVVTNFRPEFHAAWTRHSYYRQLPIAPLGESAVGDLLGALLGIDFSLAPLLGFVLERTGGNPFFVEEMVRALVEDGTLVGTAGAYRLTRPLQDVKVPANVQAVLAARIDRLEPRHKELLQMAAVVGRTCPEALLERVSGLNSEALARGLAALCGAEFLQAQVTLSGVDYRFWHPLTQEVAYDTLLTQQRRTLHASVARSLVELDPERADERAALIAGHFERAGQDLDAARWNARAATWVQNRNLAEGVRHWRATVSHLADVEPTDETRALGAWARARLLQMGSRTGMSTAEADRLVAEARALAEGLADPEPLIAVSRAFTVAQFLRGEVAASLAGGLEVVRLGDEVAGPDLRAASQAILSTIYLFAGPLAEGLLVNDVQLGLARDNPDCGVKTLGFSAITNGLLIRARLLGQAGRLDEAREALDRACRSARDRSELEWLSWALASGVDLAGWTGDLHDAHSRACEAMAIADDSGSLMFVIVSLGARGHAELMGGRFDEAVEYLSAARDMACSHHTALYQEPILLGHLAEARLGQGDADVARHLADEAVVLARQQGAQVVEVATLLTRSHVLRTTGRRSEAGADLASGLALAAQVGAATYEPMLREDLGRLHQDENELRHALRLYQRIGATGHARRLEAELPTRAAP